jgi:hypothetical protein
MPTIQLVITELSNLISQTKRRNVELRQACEKSLELLKAYRGGDESKFLQGVYGLLMLGFALDSVALLLRVGCYCRKV